jgi:hypothetical protein
LGQDELRKGIGRRGRTRIGGGWWKKRRTKGGRRRKSKNREEEGKEGKVRGKMRRRRNYVAYETVVLTSELKGVERVADSFVCFP